jgi:hypothetical protein
MAGNHSHPTGGAGCKPGTGLNPDRVQGIAGAEERGGLDAVSCTLVRFRYERRNLAAIGKSIRVGYRSARLPPSANGDRRSRNVACLSLIVAILVANDFEYGFVLIHDHQAE